MNPPPPPPAPVDDTGIRDTAARWVVRRDRRLSPAEEAEFAAWIGADARHAAAFAQSAASWQRFRAIGAAARRTPVENAPPTPLHRRWPTLAGLAAAAAWALVFFTSERSTRPDSDRHDAPPAAAGPGGFASTRRLGDGSLARLRDGAEITVDFSAAERRVHLGRGEVFFEVARDPARPFLVEVGGVKVRAIGTAFAVRCEPQSVDVLVTEGTVRITPPPPDPASPANPPPPPSDTSALVSAGHRAVVPRGPGIAEPSVVVTSISSAEVARRLAWRGPMLELDGARLDELVAIFAGRSGRRIEIADPELGRLRLGGRFPTDDLDGFVHALEELHDVKADRRADGTLVLRRTK